MSFSWTKLADGYNHYVYKIADPRTENWFLIKSPWYPALMTVCYLYFCSNARSLTSKMPAYKLRSFIIFYNAALVVLASYMSVEFVLSSCQSGCNVLCEPVDFSSSPKAMRIASIGWLYYFSKYIEMIETFVFALRKKYNQISFLHVYHHTSMLWICWWAIKYSPGGQACIFGTINSFVHAVMYSYYALSAFGPWMQKYLWWKKYITWLQLSQFVVLFFFCIQSVSRGCGFSPALCCVMVPYSVTLAILFLNFYFKSYGVKKSSKPQDEVNGVQNGIKKDN